MLLNLSRRAEWGRHGENAPNAVDAGILDGLENSRAVIEIASDAFNFRILLTERLGGCGGRRSGQSEDGKLVGLG